MRDQAELTTPQPPGPVPSVGVPTADEKPPSAIVAQWRIWKALVLRDMMAEFSESRLGYLWRIGLTVASISIVFALRAARKGGALHSMSPHFSFAVFLVTGFPLWMCFRQVCSSVLGATDRSDPLLMLPQITILDMVVAQAVSETVLQAAVFLVMCVGVSIIWKEPPAQPAEVMLMFIAVAWLGAAFGLVMCPIQRLVPPLAQIIMVFKRALMWVSGTIFTIDQIPTQYWPYLTWNPLLHCTEGARQFWSGGSYHSPIFSPIYIISCGFVLTLVGLVMERGSRRYINS